MSKQFKVALVSTAIVIGIVLLFLVIDLDADGLSNFAELQHGTAMFNSDTDGDGLSDGTEVNTYQTKPAIADTDGDGLNDRLEINTYGTNPSVTDTDADGLNDGQEISLGANPSDTDTDDDGFIDGSDSHPTTHEWKLMDSDGDGWSDYKEYFEEETNRFDSDTDDDGYTDSTDPHPTTHEWKLMDSDGDGWSDYKEYYETGTNRFNLDTDGDWAPDSGDPNPLSTARTIHREIKWDYPRDWSNKISWTWHGDLSYDLYVYRAGLQRITDYYKWSQYTVDPVSKKIAKDLMAAANKKGWKDFEKVSFALAFVQALPYSSDYGTTGAREYPRYPIETLVDGAGDCEDTSILFASIVKEMGYGTVLLHLKEDAHIAVGVLISQSIKDNWKQNYPLTTYYASNGKIYAYCETTGEGWELGHKPEDLKSTTASLIPI